MAGFKEFPTDGYEFSAAEVGQALAGLVARDGSGQVKAGMLATPAISAVPMSWRVSVGRFVYVRGVSGAARFSGLPADEEVEITSATGIPAGQARIDAVAWDPDTSTLSVVEGTPAVSPSAPSIGGLAPVLTVLVQSGDGAVVEGQVSPDFDLTSVGDEVVVPFTWDTGKLTVVRSELTVSGRWAKLRFYVKRKTGQWTYGDRLGSVDPDFAPEFIEFAPVSVTPVGPVGNVAMRPTGYLDLYTTSGTEVLGVIEWPL